MAATTGSAILDHPPGPDRAGTAHSGRRRGFRPARLLGLLFLAILLFLAGAAVWIAWGLPSLDLDRPVGGRPSITLEAADGTPISQSGGTYSGPVERSELPDHLIEAV